MSRVFGRFCCYIKKRIAVSGLKLDEKLSGHSPRALKCLLLLKSINNAKIGPRRPVFYLFFNDVSKSKHFRALGL